MALFTSLLYHIFFTFLLLLFNAPPCPAAGARGSWALLLPNVGISAMHMQLLPSDRVVMFDRTDFGTSNISLPNGKCLPNDCSAHSVEYDVASNKVRPLRVLTDVWCSSGSLTADGKLIQTGGANDGFNAVRVYESCDTCDWKEIQKGLIAGRWYATNHLLPDGRQIIIGGRGAFNYEFYPKTPANEKANDFPFLAQTTDRRIENNLYPFVFLTPDGKLFIQANTRAILFDYNKNEVVKTYPDIPTGQPRNYPSSGSAVLLPLRLVDGKVTDVEVLVCGGAPKIGYNRARHGIFDGALDDCGRIKISDPNPEWVMETMPLARVMGDLLILPNGEVLIINGASAGVAGWELGRDPVLHPVMYRPGNNVGSRFEVQNPTNKPRVYHSTAVLLRDGRVLVGGSNPNNKYVFEKVLFPTELSLEAFSPAYLDASSSAIRPVIRSPEKKIVMNYGKPVVIPFTVPGPVDPNAVEVSMVAPSFNTHSFSMNQRLLFLETKGSTVAAGKNGYIVTVTAPPSGNIAPAGHYLLFVVHKGIPSPGVWALMN